MIIKIETPCPHCGRETLEVHGDEKSICSVHCRWGDCFYHVTHIGSQEAAIKFANTRIDKEKARIISLLRDALHIVETGELIPDARTVSQKAISIFKHKCEEFFGEDGKYNPVKQ